MNINSYSSILGFGNFFEKKNTFLSNYKIINVNFNKIISKNYSVLIYILFSIPLLGIFIQFLYSNILLY